MDMFEDDLEMLRMKGIEVDNLTLKQLFPFWENSDPRVSLFPSSLEDQTAASLLSVVKTEPTAKERILLVAVIDRLKVWKEYEEYLQDIDSTDPVELAKFDTEFRRYVERKNTVHYEDDFEETFKSFSSTFERADSVSFDPSNSNTFSRGVEIDYSRYKFNLQREGSLYEEDSIELANSNNNNSEVNQSSCEDSDDFFPEGQFSMIKFLAKGGEAKVFLAKDNLVNQFVALKQFEVIESEETGFLANLIKEVNMMKSFSHPNIVKCFGLHIPPKVYEGIKHYNIVMEYIENGSLADILKTIGSFPLDEVKEIAKDVLEALSYLHNINVIFRDLKPSNIMVGEFYKLTDFGVSTQVKDLESVPRSCVGTPWYMAPEVLMQEPYSFSADIWSFGCCMYELFTGHKPFHQSNATKVITLICDGHCPLDFEETEIPKLFENFLMKCWRTPQSLRFSAKELLCHNFLTN